MHRTRKDGHRSTEKMRPSNCRRRNGPRSVEDVVLLFDRRCVLVFVRLGPSVLGDGSPVDGADSIDRLLDDRRHRRLYGTLFVLDDSAVGSVGAEVGVHRDRSEQGDLEVFECPFEPLPVSEQPVLREVAFQLQPGERVLLLGASGSGKSTLVNSLCALVPHSISAGVGGDLRIFDRSILEHQCAELAHRVGTVFQDPDSQLTMLTVEEEIAFGLENLGIPPREMDGRIESALEAVGLAPERRTRVDRLSGGMKQRLVIGAVLAMQPQLLLLDEPTSNLDPQGARDVVELLRTLAASRTETTIVLVEHRLDALVSLVTRVIALDREGTVALDAPPQQAFGPLAARLAEIDVWLPDSAQAALHLRSHGVRLPDTCWREADLLRAVRDDRGAAAALCDWSRPQTAVRRRHGGVAPVPSFSGAAVTLEAMQFSYRPGQPVLRGVDLELRRGELCAVVGGNGSGKSTLAALAAGLLRPDGGRVLIDGNDSRSISAPQLAERVGFVFQNPEHQFVTDRVLDEVAFTLRKQGVEPGESESRARQTLEALRLGPYQNRNPFELSHGQKRRLSVATMLVARKDVLIFDEPTFGQDPHALAELVLMMEKLKREGAALLMVTHDMELVWSRADRVALLVDGRIARYGPPGDLFRDRVLLQRAGLAPPLRASLYEELGGLLRASSPEAEQEEKLC